MFPVCSPHLCALIHLPLCLLSERCRRSGSTAKHFCSPLQQSAGARGQGPFVSTHCCPLVLTIVNRSLTACQNWAGLRLGQILREREHQIKFLNSESLREQQSDHVLSLDCSCIQLLKQPPFLSKNV